MAQECGFFNAQLVGEEYDRVYLAEQFAAYFASFIGNGVFGSSMQKLEVVSQTTPDMSIKVLAGEAWINGWWFRNTAEYTLSLDVADGVLSRIDNIVVRWCNSEREIKLAVEKGVPSNNPVRPALKRGADYYDLLLATVSVDAGIISVSQSKITDTRLDTSVCGLVTGAVDQIDTTDLYNQFTTYFNEFKSGHEADFDAWSEAQKNAYLTYIAEIKGQYDSYIQSKKDDYDTFTSNKKTEWENWVSEQETAFNTWVDTETAIYTNWTENQRQTYANWYSTNTTQWESDFYTWFQSVKDKLGTDAAGSLQNQVDDLEAKQPTVQVAEIVHSKDVYLHCDMYETTYACGTQGAGEGPAGGAALISAPLEYVMEDRDHVKIKAVSGLGTVDEVNKLSDDMYAICFENKIKSLIVILDDRK